jgi:hypothetical protein
MRLSRRRRSAASCFGAKLANGLFGPYPNFTPLSDRNIVKYSFCALAFQATEWRQMHTGAATVSNFLTS